MRAVSRTVIVLVVLVASGGAFADTAGTSKLPPLKVSPLKPESIRPEWNAAIITSACMAAAPKLKDAKCAAYEFCKDPLKAPKLLTADDIGQLGKGQCPVTPLATLAKTESATPGGTSWQEDVISGLVAFLVERAKAEALATLVQHIKDDLCTQRWKNVMPATCGLLANSEPYTDPIAWSPIKAALESDLQQLPERLIRELVAGDDAEPLLSTLEAANLIEHGATPIEVLVGLRTKYATVNDPTTCKNYKYSCALKVFGSAVEILMPNAESQSPSEDYAKLYLQVVVRLLSTVGTPLGTPDLLSDTIKVQQLVTEVRDALVALQTQAKNAKTAVDAFYAGKAGASVTGARQSFANYVRSVSNALELLSHTMPISSVAESLDGAWIEDVFDHAVLTIEYARSGEYVKSFVELQATLAAAHANPPEWFGKYGGFFVEVASAKTPDDVQHALDAVAAPVGAWRTKRGRGHSALTINGYVGMQGGYEWLSHDAPGSPHLGLFAPVGIESSWGFGKAWSAGFLLSVIDLGALVDVRSDSTQSSTAVSSTSNIGFRQVFSPGVYGLLGLGVLGGVPLAFGAGVSLSPELRSVDVTGGTSFDASALRFSAFLAIDVTIFGF